jgi:hypothetical protein
MARFYTDRVGSDTESILAGAAGIPTFPAAAAPADDVSLAEVIRSVWAGLMGTATGENGVATFPAAAAPANNVSLAEVLNAVYNLVVPTVEIGETDIDVTAADYTTVGGIPILTITPAAGAPLADVYVDFDFLKDTTGLFVVYTTQTVQFMVQVKVDGTNWRTVAHWPSTAHLGLAVPDAAQDLDALDDSPAHRFHIGHVGVDEEVRITVTLSAEDADAEIPFAVYYKAMAAPTITPVVAG